ncbi:hypothetical protein D3C71_1323250 [compost metagenome]
MVADRRPGQAYVLHEVGGVQDRIFQPGRVERVFYRYLAGVIRQARVGRLDDRRKHELPYRALLRRFDQGDTHCRFVGRKGGADMEDAFHALGCPGKAAGIAKVSLGDLCGSP